ncbi:pyridoxal kinase [Chitinophaga rhizosphaerae]|uniref:pyridoxal kinase n=1 Tax=Chitinophaga rhizosphaerae TaxID=1864947 RepID=UPI000F807B05|nr:pyridoxal kinase [Chitinophaga rhizosphaerae]
MTTMPVKRDKTIIIHSKVSYGYVGSSTTALVLQTGRQDVITVPTVLYSNRLGLASVGGDVLPTALFASILDGILQLDILAEVTSIITGFIGSAEQVGITAGFVEKVKAQHPEIIYLCDPVMGDADEFYVAPGVPGAMINRLIPLADVLTPNFFELQQMLGGHFSSLEEMAAAIRENGRFSEQELVVTSCRFADTPPGWLDIVSLDNGQLHLERTPRVAVDPPGTGELFAAHMHLQMLHGVAFPTAIRRAARVMQAVLTGIKTDNRREMALQDILHSMEIAGREAAGR